MDETEQEQDPVAKIVAQLKSAATTVASIGGVCYVVGYIIVSIYFG